VEFEVGDFDKNDPTWEPPNPKKSFPCLVCNKQMKQKKYLQKHMLTHTQKKRVSIMKRTSWIGFSKQMSPKETDPLLLGSGLKNIIRNSLVQRSTLETR
jgi:hypothetical protein